MSFTAMPSEEGPASTVIDKPILTQMNKLGFQKALNENPGGLIIKFGAEWCGPCKKIDPVVYRYMNQLPENIRGAVLDIDECFELYAFLKMKKQVNGVPVILFYKKGTISWIPDHVVVGADESQVHAFFKRCFDAVI
jgi:thiol-disulfide isomerase/thioredoxin